jgi:hypothetical protein
MSLKSNQFKYSIESSFNFEDKDKQYPEKVIVVQSNDEGTETIATFNTTEKDDDYEGAGLRDGSIGREIRFCPIHPNQGA